MSEYIQVVTTLPSEEQANHMVEHLVREHLAACAQISGPIASTYRWQGLIESAEEWVVVAKTRLDRYEAIEAAVRKLHPYQVPEITALPMVAISQSYREWIDQALVVVG